MKTIIADTNALIMPFKSSINLDSELRGLVGTYKIIVPAPIIGELKRLEDRVPQARSALRFARTKEIVETETDGDRSVMEAAEKLDGIILTNDRELIALALKKKIPVIRLMGGKKLALVDHKNG
ncbi:MAG: twitching motility protein PilT [Thermoplasmata archaeon]|nr:twitching motility protein PilT [Thermoplasmata archaeon]